ncbi:MAG: ComF family protein [Vicinamibacteria bacterium]
MDVGRAVLGLVLPERCLACGRGEELLCAECRRGLLVLRGTLCARCGCPTAWPVERCGECTGRRLAFASARAAVAYDGTARALVTAWKERGIARIAGLAAVLVAETVPQPQVEALAFVPGEGDRVGWRGANPAEELAGALAGRWGLPVERLLERARHVRPQRGLSRAERRVNIRAAFRARGASPKAVGLVDDVYTTGATVGAAATELRRAGARAVHVVAFARTVRG